MFVPAGGTAVMTGAIGAVLRALAWRYGFMLRQPAPEPRNTFVPGAQAEDESDAAWRCRMRRERRAHDRLRLAARPWLGHLYPEWADALKGPSIGEAIAAMDFRWVPPRDSREDAA